MTAAFQTTGTPQVPWHLWGGTVPLVVQAGGAQVVGQQVCKVSYRRPETWSFWFGARIVSGPLNTDPTDPYVIHARFDLIVGVGRSNFQTYDNLNDDGGVRFCDFVFSVAPGNRPSTRPKWTTSVNSPPVDDRVATSIQRLDRFPAEEIQCLGTVVQDELPAASEVRLELSAYFSPVNHIRPDWFPLGGQFLGEERGGT